MSPSPICTHKTLRVKSSKRVAMMRSGLLACFVLLGVLSPQLAVAVDDYPNRQIKIIVPFPPGAGPDQVARMLGQYLQNAFGQTVVIENRTGALGSIGAQEVARSAPDGYTLLMGTNTTQAANVAMLKNLPYDPAKDFAPIIRTITTAMVLVVKPDFPAKNLVQFMEYARTHANLTAGYGSGASQISIGQLQTRGGMSVIAASYRGVPQAVTDVIAGVVDLAFADFSIAIPQISSRSPRCHYWSGPPPCFPIAPPSSMASCGATMQSSIRERAGLLPRSRSAGCAAAIRFRCSSPTRPPCWNAITACRCAVRCSTPSIPGSTPRRSASSSTTPKRSC